MVPKNPFRRDFLFYLFLIGGIISAIIVYNCASQCFGHEGHWLAGFGQGPVKLEREKFHIFKGHMYSDGFWRGDLDDLHRGNHLLVKAINGRRRNKDGVIVWNAPTWMNEHGWVGTDNVRPYPTKFKPVGRRMCDKTIRSCFFLETLKFNKE